MRLRRLGRQARMQPDALVVFGASDDDIGRLDVARALVPPARGLEAAASDLSQG
jgi:hypothetical protein